MVSRDIIVIIVVTLFAYLVSCGGGNGNDDEEFTVFDVTISVLGVEPKDGRPTNCPETANLKLSLHTIDNDISGFAELIEFGNIGDPRDVSGVIEGSNFNLEPFSVNVYTDPPSNGIPFVGELAFNFDVFEGFIVTDEEEMPLINIDGTVSGDILFGETDAITCSAKFTGDFYGISRSPEGCVSPVEAPTIECPAEGFVSQCDAYSDYFCFGWCVPSDLGDICGDLSFKSSECEVIDCLTISCPGTGLVDLEGNDNYGSFQYVTPIGTTESCF